MSLLSNSRLDIQLFTCIYIQTGQDADFPQRFELPVLECMQGVLTNRPTFCTKLT